MNSPGSKALLAYAKRGLTYSQAAEILGVKTRTVEHWVRSYGINAEYQDLKREALAPPPAPIVPCEGCGTSEHDGSYGSGRFCGEKCARGFATRNMGNESNARRLEGLQKGNQAMQDAWAKWREEMSSHSNKESNRPNRIVNRPYSKPNPVIWTDEMKQEAREKAILRWQDPIYRAKQMENRSERCKSALTPEVRSRISISVKKAMEEGRLSPWQSRGPNMRSYPEQVWDNVLEENGIAYEPEHLIIKSTIDPSAVGNYFIDSLIEVNGVKVDLEIDGKQHLLPERAASDKIRDELLERGGYIVYRIPWVSPAHELNTFREQVSNLLTFLDSLQ